MCSRRSSPRRMMVKEFCVAIRLLIDLQDEVCKMSARPVFCKSLAPMLRSRARRVPLVEGPFACREMLHSRARRVTIALFVSGRLALLIYRKHTMLQAELQADRGVTTVHATGYRTGCTA